MTGAATHWHAPRSLREALDLREDYGDETVVVAGGTFLGVLINNGVLAPEAMLSLRDVPELRRIEIGRELTLGAMVTHREVENHPEVRRLWPALAHMFSLVASPRIRNRATVGGVLADADYASDPPSMLAALGARVVLEGPRGRRELPVEDFILGLYETAIGSDELLTSVVVPGGHEAAVYRKFRTRSHEDRPCVSVAAARHSGRLRVVVGAAAMQPQFFPDVCGMGASPREIADEYAGRIDALSDARGSAEYRRRVVAVEVRRAIEETHHG